MRPYLRCHRLRRSILVPGIDTGTNVVVNQHSSPMEPENHSHPISCLLDSTPNYEFQSNLAQNAVTSDNYSTSDAVQTIEYVADCSNACN